MPKTSSFTITRTMNATPERVFDALTTSRQITAWSAQKGSVKAAIGGKISFFDGWVSGVVLAYLPGKQLSFTWLPSDWPEGTQPSIVSIGLTKKKSGTAVTLKHSVLPSVEEKNGHKKGWDDFVFTPLKLWLEQENA